MEHVLVVDDEQPMRELIRFHLAAHGFQVFEAMDGIEALSLLQRHSFDLVIVDWMMPGMSGLQLAQQVRGFSGVPMIMLTARNQLPDKVEGLSSGADDYITKPFEEEELIARIRALLRRASVSHSSSQVIHYQGLTVNLDAREAAYGGQVIPLTQHEFELLRFLMKHPKQSLSRSQLIEYVWGYDYEGDERTVDSHIRNLRAKLKQAGNSDFIKTVWGVGYQLS